MELHAVGMLGHGLAPVKEHMLFLDESHGMRAQQRQGTPGAHLQQHLGNVRGIDVIGRVAHEAQHDALVGAVPLARGAQRAVELDPHLSRAREQAVALQALDEKQRRPHGPHRVGAGRTYANLEQIEYRDGHCPSPIFIGNYRYLPNQASMRFQPSSAACLLYMGR